MQASATFMNESGHCKVFNVMSVLYEKSDIKTFRSVSLLQENYFWLDTLLIFDRKTNANSFVPKMYFKYNS